MPQAQSWFRITNKSADTAEIDIFDEIGFWGVSAKDFVNQLRSAGAFKHITLNIDCPGGDCNDGFTIFDAIKASNAKVTANITGLAASMASVIMLAAEKITIAENGRVMIHRVTTGAYGNADDVDAAAKVARQFEERIISLYMARTKADEATVRDWMKAEMGTWFFGKEAVAAGFADSLIAGSKARAFQPRWASMFTMLPSALFDISAHTPPGHPDPTSLIMKLTAEQKNRLHALLRQSDLADAEKTELQTLSDQAKKEGYDAAAAILSEDQAAAAQKKKDADAAAAALALKQLSPEQQTAINALIDSRITAATTPLLDRVNKAETLIKAGIHSAAGGRPAVDLGKGDEGEGDKKTMARAEFDKLDHTARNKFFAEGGKLLRA